MLPWGCSGLKQQRSVAPLNQEPECQNISLAMRVTDIRSSTQWFSNFSLTILSNNQDCTNIEKIYFLNRDIYMIRVGIANLNAKTSWLN